jgi:CRP-like cAMP-binding protein
MGALDFIFRILNEIESFPAGQVIFKCGETGDEMYVVKEGEVDIMVGDVVVETARPGAIVGEMALIDKCCRSATAVAKSDCKLVPINEARFRFLVQQNPFFSLHVMQVMAERLRSMNKQIEPGE